MKTQISISEVDALIRQNINQKGLKNHISDEQIEEIKNKIKARLAMPTAGVFYANPIMPSNSVIDSENDFSGEMGGGMEEAVLPTEDDEVVEVPTDDSPISHETIIDDKSIEMAKKEGELEAQQNALANKEQELNSKEQDLTYKPVLPNSILQAEPGQLFVYDMSQLSLGGESLSQQPYNIVASPESKTSMHDLWINDAKHRAEIYKVEYKKIGEMVFDPSNGTSKFVEMQQPLESDLPKEQRDGVQHAIDSQIPTEPMIDATEPVMDVTLPMSNDMGLQSVDIQKTLEQTVEKLLRQYFTSGNA